MQQIRARLRAARWDDPQRFRGVPHDTRVRVAGLVTLRQRPETASGVTFLTMEDEVGLVNVIVWLKTAEQQRRELLESRLLGVEGQWENAEDVRHLVAHRLFDLSSMLGELDVRSRDFH